MNLSQNIYAWLLGLEGIFPLTTKKAKSQVLIGTGSYRKNLRMQFGGFLKVVCSIILLPAPPDRLFFSPLTFNTKGLFGTYAKLESSRYNMSFQTLQGTFITYHSYPPQNPILWYSVDITVWNTVASLDPFGGQPGCCFSQHAQ